MPKHSMRTPFLVVAALAVACGGGSAGTTTSSGDSSSGGSEARSGEFQLSDSDTAGQARGDHPSQIEATATHAAMRLFVVDPDAGPIPHVVIKLTGADGSAYYTGETDLQGYAEALVPAGQRYDLEYLSMGRRTTTAHVDVPAGPRQDIRLTLRHRRRRPAPAAATPSPEAPAEPEQERLVLEGIVFGTGSATIQPESGPQLDRVVEYLTHRPSVRLRIAGHTDDVGNAARNQALSESRARSVRDYLVSHGIDGGRVEAVGYGPTQPVAPNDTEEGRQQNRRIEAIEL